MINRLVLLFLITNLVSFLFAADEVNTLPLEPSPPLGSYLQSSLPQLNLDYDTLASPLLKFGKDDSTYCPHTEILTRVLNELRNLPQGGENIKNILSNYYFILEKALNSIHNVDSSNNFNLKNHLSNIDFLTQRLITMDNKNLKIKVSFEYELPKIHETICKKLCNDIINFAKAGSSAATNDLNYANEQGKMNKNAMAYLQNYRPDKNNAISPSNKKFKNPNSDSLSSNQGPLQLPIPNSLQSHSPLLPSYTGSAFYDPLQNLPLPLQGAPNTDSEYIQHLSPSLSSSTGNANFFFLQNLAALLQKTTGNSDYSKYLLPPLQNLTGNSNSYSLHNLAFLLPSLTDTTTYPTKYPLPHQLESTGISNNYPFVNSIPLQQSSSGSLLSSKLKGNFNPLQILSLYAQMSRGIPNSYSLPILGPPKPSTKGIGNNNRLQNAAFPPQNPTGPEDIHSIQSLLPQYVENVKNIEAYINKINENYHKPQKNIIYNNDNAQHINENDPTIATSTRSQIPGSAMFPNSWSQPNYSSTNNKYSNNEKLLQERLIQLNNQHRPLVTDLVLETTTLNPKNLYQNFNTNSLPGIKQYENAKLEIDPSSAKANSLQQYNQYLELMKNLIYAQTNPGTKHLLNQQNPYSSQNVIPVSYEKNNALYNAYVNNLNQQATQTNIPNNLAMYPNLYNYYNPNLAITNSAKGTQEKNGVQFQDLHRLLAVSNLDKLNSLSNKNGIVELTYKVRHSKPYVEPFYYVKYRLPYDLFLLNYKKVLNEKPNLRYNPHLIYKDLLIGSNITASSSELNNFDKGELLKLVSTNGTLVTVQFLDAKDATANEQIKIVQKLNANMPLKDIVKTETNITKDSGVTSNIPLVNYLGDRSNYLNDLQKKLAVNRLYLNRYNTQANNQNVQYPTYLANRLPTSGYNYLQNKLNYPHSSYRLNTYPRYYGYGG